MKRLKCEQNADFWKKKFAWIELNSNPIRIQIEYNPNTMIVHSKINIQIQIVV